MIRSSVIPTRRRRWPTVVNVLATSLLMVLVVRAITADAPSEAARREAAVHGYDQGYADAMNQVADTIGAAYSHGYRTAQREAHTGCPSLQRDGGPL